jgi:hypothetical protein
VCTGDEDKDIGHCFIHIREATQEIRGEGARGKRHLDVDLNKYKKIRYQWIQQACVGEN